jgi:hypothetical protein
MKYVYLIQSIPFPDQRYIGITSPLKNSVTDHNEYCYLPAPWYPATDILTPGPPYPVVPPSDEEIRFQICVHLTEYDIDEILVVSKKLKPFTGSGLTSKITLNRACRPLGNGEIRTRERYINE